MPNASQFKLLETYTDKFEFFILNESSKNRNLELYHICEKTKSFNDGLIIKCSKGVEIQSESLHIDFDCSIIKNSCITTNRHYLVIFAHSSISYFDSSNGYLIASYDLTSQPIMLDYFLSPTNLFTHRLASLSATPGSDHVLALSNLKHLVLIKLTDSDNHLSTSMSSISRQPNRFDSFKVNFKCNIVLAHDEAKQEIVVFDLNVIAGKNSFQARSCVLFKIELTKSDTKVKSTYGCDLNFEYIYVIEKKKVLRVFTIGKYFHLIV